MKKNTSSPALIVLALVLLAGAAAAHAAPPETQSEEKPPAQEMPPGHPQLTTPPTAADAIPKPPPGSGTGATGLRWLVPAGWTEVPPANAMRKAQYKVPGEAGDGEMVVFYFGPGQGGPARANAERWAGQFTLADGRPGTEGAEIETLAHGELEVTRVEVAGTYNGGMTMGGPAPQPIEGYMLLGAIASGPDANWFFKLTGPETTLRQHEEAFDALLAAIETGK
jgi:hypothetical protein